MLLKMMSKVMSKIMSKHICFQPICLSNTFWRRLVCVWSRIWTVLKRLWTFLKRFEGVWEHLASCSLELAFFCYFVIHIQKKVFNLCAATTALEASCVWKKPCLGRVEASLNHLEQCWRRLAAPYVLLGAASNSELATYMVKKASFQHLCFI